MNSKTIVNLCVTGLFVLGIIYTVDKWKSKTWQDNPAYPFLAILALAIVGGFFFVFILLPKLGDAVGTMMYSSGEETKIDESMKAAAKMASGDYQGAIDEYQKMIKEKPDDAFPISEIGKILSDKFHDPGQAITFIQGHLEAKEWSEDNAAFLMFRLVDIQAGQKDYAAAKDILEQVAGNFPGTRHSANARHRINELEQAEFKELQAQRAKQSSQGA